MFKLAVFLAESKVLSSSASSLYRMAQQPITLWVGPHPQLMQADKLNDAETEEDLLSPARTQVHTPSLQKVP